MTTRLLLATASAFAFSGWKAYGAERTMAPSAASNGPGKTPSSVLVEAAMGLLNSLTDEQRGKVLFPFTPQESAKLARFARNNPPGGGGGPRNGTDGPGARGSGGADSRAGSGDASGRRGPGGPDTGPGGGFVGEQYGAAIWSNYPVSDVPRPGLQLGSLTDVQRSAAMRVLEVLLSPKGYQKVLEIMGSDQALADGGTRYASGTQYYTIGLFGEPSTATPWMVQFGGHHLGLNVTLAGGQGTATPTLTGAQPAVYSANGRTVRALAQENDKAFALLNALDDSHRAQVILKYRVGDLVLGPGRDGETLLPEGLKAAGMKQEQRELLLDLISEWAGLVNEAYSTGRMAEIKAGLDDTYFAWSGPTTHAPDRNGSAYYRIQGPKVFIEFSPQGVGGDPSQHVHTIYRDPTNNYGRALIAQ